MVVDLKKAFAWVVAQEKAHGRKIAAAAVYLLTHPAQVHTAVAEITHSLVTLVAGVAS